MKSPSLLSVEVVEHEVSTDHVERELFFLSLHVFPAANSVMPGSRGLFFPSRGAFFVGCLRRFFSALSGARDWLVFVILHIQSRLLAGGTRPS